MSLEKRYLKEYRYTGFETEEECIGPKIDWSVIFKKIKTPEKGFSRKELIQVIKENYPLNPLSPQKKWSADLVNFIEDELGLKQDAEAIEFYNVLGSPLDQKGIDCLLTLKNPITKKEIDFGIDLTKNKSKDDWEINKSKPSQWGAKKPKADHIIDIKKFPDHRHNEEGYIQEMEKESMKIADKLKEKSGPIIH